MSHTAKLKLEDVMDIIERKNFPFFRVLSAQGSIISENIQTPILEEAQQQLTSDTAILANSLIYCKIQIARCTTWAANITGAGIGSAFKHGLQYDIILNEVEHEKLVQERTKQPEEKKEDQQQNNHHQNNNNHHQNNPDMQAKDMLSIFQFMMSQQQQAQKTSQDYTGNLMRLQKDFYGEQIQNLRQDKNELASKLDELFDEISNLKDGKEDRLYSAMETIGAGLMGGSKTSEDPLPEPVSGVDPEQKQALELLEVLKKVDPKYLQNLHAITSLAVNDPEEYKDMFEQDQELENAE